MNMEFCSNGSSYIGLSELCVLHSLPKDEKQQFMNDLKEFLSQVGANVERVGINLYDRL